VGIESVLALKQAVALTPAHKYLVSDCGIKSTILCRRWTLSPKSGTKNWASELRRTLQVNSHPPLGNLGIFNDDLLASWFLYGLTGPASRHVSIVNESNRSSGAPSPPLPPPIACLLPIDPASCTVHMEGLRTEIDT
jgi:hypothetical protein